MLIGHDYWGGLVDWLRDTALAEGKLSEKDLDVLTVTDDVEEAVAIMVRAREGRVPSRPGEPSDGRSGRRGRMTP